MNPSLGPWITSLHWHQTGELSDEDCEIVISALAQTHDQPVMELNRLLQKALLPAAC